MAHIGANQAYPLAEDDVQMSASPTSEGSPIMLGEKLGEEHGKVTTRRVIPGGDPRYVSMEISFESSLTLLV